jgi:hypothetical protein
VKLTTHLHLFPRSRTRGTIPPFSQYAFMAWCLVKAQGLYLFLTLPCIVNELLNAVSLHLRTMRLAYFNSADLSRYLPWISSAPVSLSLFSWQLFLLHSLVYSSPLSPTCFDPSLLKKQCTCTCPVGSPAQALNVHRHFIALQLFNA